MLDIVHWKILEALEYTLERVATEQLKAISSGVTVSGWHSTSKVHRNLQAILIERGK